jgi:DNA-binding transcriptional MerR regulator
MSCEDGDSYGFKLIMEATFPTPVAAMVARVARSTLMNWNNRRILVPTTRARARERRAARLYTFRDLVAVRVLVALRDLGVDLGGLRSVVAYVRKYKGISATEPLKPTILVVDGDQAFDLDAASAALSGLFRSGQRVVHAIALDEIVADLQREARALGSVAA